MGATRRRTSGHFGRSPRTFVLGLTVTLALAIAASLVIQGTARSRQEDAAASKAELIADTVLAPTLTTEDVQRPVSGRRYDELSDIVADDLLIYGSFAVEIVRRDGTVVFATDKALVGRPAAGDPADLESVFAGSVKTRVMDATGGWDRAFETLVPLSPRADAPATSVAIVAQDDATLRAAVGTFWGPLRVGLGVLLIACIALAINRSLRSRASSGDAWLTTSSATREPPSEADTRMIQAEERARQAEIAQRTVAEQLRHTSEVLSQAESSKQAALERARQAEDGVRIATNLQQSTEVALRMARERIGQLEGRLEKAEAPMRSLQDAEERFRRAEESLAQARQELGVAETEQERLEAELKHAVSRVHESETERERLEAANRLLTDDARRREQPQPRPEERAQDEVAAEAHVAPADQFVLAESIPARNGQTREVLEIREAPQEAPTPATAPPQAGTIDLGDRVDVAALVRRVVDGAGRLADREVRVEAPPSFATVNRGRAEHVVEGLLANAWRRTSPGEPVWVTVGSNHEGVTILVDDAGPEIPVQLRETMFASFPGDPETSAANPSAAGLFLVSRLAELQGGRVWVEERPGGGASFRVFLPDASLDEARSGEPEWPDIRSQAPAS